MTQTDAQSGPTAGKGKAFFDRADEVAETGNWDFAVELYIEGIKREPGNIERGHRLLRETALKRKVQGGKGSGITDKLKRRPGKDAEANMANASYLLAKEPGSVAYMEQVLKAARALELPEVIKWICDILLESQRQAKKPNTRILGVITQTYDDIEEYASAIQSCDLARLVLPDDGPLQEALSNLSAKYTLQKGKYGQEGDFTKGVADLDKQKELVQKDMLAQDRQFLETQIESTRNDYLGSPTVPGKIGALVDALLKIEEETYENEAIDILTKAHTDTGAYQFKMRIGDIKVRQMTRRYRKLATAGDEKAATEQLKNQLAFELAEYTERAINYPTDLALKFELGRRQLLSKQYDEAIASLQQAQRDPRRHVAAMNYLGQAFEAKEWYREAAETFHRALSTEMSEERTKEIRYNLGTVLEKTGDFERARDEFSTVAQIDFNYKDVRQRLEKVNETLKQAPRDSTGG
ncbi:MAG: tetratricopeptide repeat protein [Phycisphaerae bacterium]|jgi:TolA-binding protein|nr:tetratricopeptide repeat protein [Phycisphaerae bacterium]